MLLPTQGQTQALVSVSVVGDLPQLTDEQVAETVRAELSEWFGREHTDTWRHLRTIRIPHAQPRQCPPSNLRRPVRAGGLKGLYVCGDHRESATLEGAICSGRRAAEAFLEDRRAGVV